MFFQFGDIAKPFTIFRVYIKTPVTFGGISVSAKSQTLNDISLATPAATALSLAFSTAFYYSRWR